MLLSLCACEVHCLVYDSANRFDRNDFFAQAMSSSSIGVFNAHEPKETGREAIAYVNRA